MLTRHAKPGDRLDLIDEAGRPISVFIEAIIEGRVTFKIDARPTVAIDHRKPGQPLRDLTRERKQE